MENTKTQVAQHIASCIRFMLFALIQLAITFTVIKICNLLGLGTNMAVQLVAQLLLSLINGAVYLGIEARIDEKNIALKPKQGGKHEET